MSDSLKTIKFRGSPEKPGVSPAETVPVHVETALERRGQSARVFLSTKLGLANFGVATHFHSVKSARASFTSSFISTADSGRKTIWHASCFIHGDVSSFPRWSAGREIPSRGRRTAFTENWTAPMTGRFPHISNQPTIK